MTENQKKEAGKLPQLVDLYKDKGLEIRKNDLAFLLNQKPSEDWIQKHPYVKDLKYIPIGRIEWLMTSIYKSWKVEIKEIQLIGNSIVATVRVHYCNPLDGLWDYTDGVGASVLQTDKGAGAIDFNFLKSSAVQMAAPSAETYAIKDACEKLGKLFGKDLNRGRDIGYENIIKQSQKLQALKTKEP